MPAPKPKYRSWDSPPFEEPHVEWGPSLTDPSQDIKVDRLVADHVRRGSPPHALPFGEDLSRVGFTEATLMLRAAEEGLAAAKDADAEAQAKAKADADAAQAALRGRLLQQLKAGSPELQQLAAELTRVLPGFEAAVPAAEGGGS